MLAQYGHSVRPIAGSVRERVQLTADDVRPHRLFIRRARNICGANRRADVRLFYRAASWMRSTARWEANMSLCASASKGRRKSSSQPP